MPYSVVQFPVHLYAFHYSRVCTVVKRQFSNCNKKTRPLWTGRLGYVGYCLGLLAANGVNDFGDEPCGDSVEDEVEGQQVEQVAHSVGVVHRCQQRAGAGDEEVPLPPG